LNGPNIIDILVANIPSIFYIRGKQIEKIILEGHNQGQGSLKKRWY